MSEQEIEVLLEKNLEVAFGYFEQVTDEGSSKDNGDTSRILSLVKEID